MIVLIESLTNPFSCGCAQDHSDYGMINIIVLFESLANPFSCGGVQS